MTPAEFKAYAQGRMEDLRERAELRNRQDYNLAVMVRSAVWVEKRMPPFSRFFEDHRTKKTMSDEEMYRNVLALNAALGGTIIGE